MAVIPTRNPAALTAYYLGVFSLIPILGLVVGIPAMILGFLGVKAAMRQPQREGKGHAIAGLVLGSISSLLWGGVVLLFVFAAFTGM